MKQVIEVTKEEFESVDIEAPIRDCKRVDCMSLSAHYAKATLQEQDNGNEAAASVYRLLRSVTEMHFKPEDRAEPFGPCFIGDGQRTIIPSDLRGGQSRIFSEIAPSIRNPGLRARLSDIAWHNDRTLVEMSRQAVSAYCEAVQQVRNEHAEFFGEQRSASSRDGCNMLRRACQIEAAIGWKDPEGKVLVSLIKEVLNNTMDSSNSRGLLRIGHLTLDFRIGDLVTVADYAEQLAGTDNTDPLDSNLLWELAARVYQLSGNPEESNRCRARAAECYVTKAMTSDSSMAKASWLMDAIEALRQAPDTKQRREELEAQLREAQVSMQDEFITVSTDVDLTDLVKDAEKRVAGVGLANALEKFANLSDSPEPTKLRDEVHKQAKESVVLGSMPLSMQDEDGKVVAHSPGLGVEDGDVEAIRQLIVRNESFRRQSIALGLIEPARQRINLEHPLDQCYFRPLVELSWFVPRDRADIISLGFARFFNGDFISALHILVPQLENSLRNVLKKAGANPSGIKSDMTQENRTLSVMLEKDRETLERIFGSAIVYEIENLFDVRGGPSFRHQVAHGLVSSHRCYEPDAIYACWFIFRLCCLPLFPRWNEVTDRLDQLMSNQ